MFDRVRSDPRYVDVLSKSGIDRAKKGDSEEDGYLVTVGETSTGKKVETLRLNALH